MSNDTTANHTITGHAINIINFGYDGELALSCECGWWHDIDGNTGNLPLETANRLAAGHHADPTAPGVDHHPVKAAPPKFDSCDEALVASIADMAPCYEIDGVNVYVAHAGQSTRGGIACHDGSYHEMTVSGDLGVSSVTVHRCVKCGIAEVRKPLG